MQRIISEGNVAICISLPLSLRAFVPVGHFTLKLLEEGYELLI
jgi:hypothetical protein